MPQLDPAAKKAWYKINFSDSETGLVQNLFEFFSGLQLYRKEVRTNSDSRICTCSILCGLVSAPSLPPESLGQIGFAVVSLGVSGLVGKFPGSSRECAQEITRKRVGRARGSGAGETGRGIADRGSHRNRPV